MANRMGLVVVFKDGVTRAQAEAALASLNGLVEPKLMYPGTDYRNPVVNHNPSAHIETFNDEHGGPVWYIP